MKYSTRKRLPLAMMLALASFTAHAAGLGRLSVASGLGEPFNADIEVFGAPAELASMSAQIAAPEEYAAQGLERPHALDAVKVSVEKKADGSAVLHLNSARPIEDPFVELIVQVEWQSGKLSREYNALLDPPGFGERAEIAKALPVVPDNKPGVTAKQKPMANNSSEVYGTKSMPVPSVATIDGISQQTYLTKRGDTLRQIALKVKVDDVSVEQMIVGLYRENSNAFVKGNMNRLKIGQNLGVPSTDAVNAISQDEAVQEIKLQTANWSAYRARVANLAVRSRERNDTGANHPTKARASVEDRQKTTTDRYVLTVSPGDTEYSLGTHDGKKSVPKKMAPERQ